MIKRVAIIGASFRLPGTDPDRFWQDLLDGRDLVTEVDPSRWARDRFFHPRKNHPGTSYTFAAGSIGNVAGFDAHFFGISPREAAFMDPQQRLLLELSWEALENAGAKPSSLRGSRCGVFIGIASADYSYRLADDLAVIDASVATGNTASIAANRISYVFDLRGPSMAIDTACSSSLVAFHQACCSILSGESVQALAGGISLHLHPYGFLSFAKASMLSPNGRCRVFDASADGYVRSEGGGIFFLKDYEQALADGDPIVAVVVQTGVNADGRKSGLTVPSPQSQAALLVDTYARAGVDPAALDYLEAHGTGTAVGDPIEAQAIGEALGKRRAPDQPLPIGSIKGNVGHLEAASGVAGLVKAVHCLRHRTVPATVGLRTPNPAIDLRRLNVEIVTDNRPLKQDGRLIVGINSFGFGGANAHVILESPEPDSCKIPTPEPSPPITVPLLLTAREPNALRQAAVEFAGFLESNSNALYDTAYSAFFRRDWHPHRVIVRGTDSLTVAETLRAVAADSGNLKVQSGVALDAPVGPAFVYSGNGSQWEGMGRGLLAEEPLFREAIEEIDSFFKPLAGYALVKELSGALGAERMQRTEYAQPALFAVQVGITTLLRHRGIVPVAVAGHSVGEVAASLASGILSLEEAVRVIVYRSRLQETTRGMGQMTAVGVGQQAAVALLLELELDKTLVIAGVNSCKGVTVAGNPQQLELLEACLTGRNIFFRRLALDYAFHSPAMDCIQQAVLASLAELHPTEGTIPFYSSVTGDRVEGTDLAAVYWWRNIRQPVLFEATINSVQRAGVNIFVEIGPHAVLRSYLHDCLRENDREGRIIATLMRGDEGPERVWAAWDQVVLAGGSIDGSALFPSPGQWVQLPNYPWQREQYWHPTTSEANGTLDRHTVHPLLGYALRQQEHVWENQLDVLRFPTLADHVVGDTTIFPGTGFAELALAASLAWQGGECADITDLEIRSPLVFDREHAVAIRVQVDDQDGTWRVSGREYAGSDPWVVHAVARILKEPGDSALQITCPDMPLRQPDFTGASHAGLTKAAGLQYGPAFQCVDHGWIENDTALAVLTVPNSISHEVQQMHLHPALLDNSFQLIIQLLREQLALHEGFTFVPVKMGRIVFRTHSHPPGLVQVKVRRRTAQTICADFVLFAADGQAIAVIREARFRSIRLGKATATKPKYLAYQWRPMPLAGSSDTGAHLSFKGVRCLMADVVRRSSLSGIHRRYTQELDPLLESVCSQWNIEALRELAEDSRFLSRQKVQSCEAAHPQIAPLLGKLLRHAQEDQQLIGTADGWTFESATDEQTTAQAIWNSLLAEYPDYFSLIHAVGRVGMHLPALLVGTMTPEQVWSRRLSTTTLFCQVLGGAGKQKIGQALRQLIGQSLRQLPEGNRLRVLEVGRCTPFYAGDAKAAMDFACCDYVFVGTSASLLEEMAHLKERLPQIEVHHLDGSAGSPPVMAQYQLAVVTMDFKTQAEATRALAYARSGLVAGGIVLVIGLHAARWIDFISGNQQDQSFLPDEGGRSFSQYSAQFWQQQLEQLRLHDISLLEFSPDTLSGPYILLAQATEESVTTPTVRPPLPRSWLFLTDANGPSAHLADRLAIRLQGKGDLVLQAAPGDVPYLSSLLQETTSNYGLLDGIVHLAGLASSAGRMGPEELLDLQVARCSLAANILQACAANDIQTTFWLLTEGVCRDTLPERYQGAQVGSIALPGDAALWGFGRTMMNESFDVAIRMVDLESLTDMDAVAAALDQEFDLTSDDQEIMLSSQGKRYVPRLNFAEHFVNDPVKTGTDGEPPLIRLGFRSPGKLGNLRWERCIAAPLGDNEVEGEVCATGLNFRDLMFTLGLLAEEAIENGFAGATLGLEFSGVVRRVGDKVSTYSPGDKVVGFGPSCFANRVRTTEDALTLMPSGLSYEAAATIPCTFFTVYYALQHLAQLQQGERVLIHCAAGGVGIAAIQVAKWLGAEIFVTAGSDAKRDFLRLLGVDHIFDSRSLAFADQIMEVTGGQGVDVVLNSLASEAINRNFQILKPFGRFLELGKRDFYENTKIGLRPFRNNISYFGIDTDQLMQARPQLTQRLFAEVMVLFKQGVLHPLPYQTFEAEDVLDAFRFMQQARHIGKIVVTYRGGIPQVHPSQAELLQQRSRKHLNLPSDATYLVTGGLGGFGLRTAQWLVARGARNLVLISRSGPANDEAKEAVTRMASGGVNVLALACDVTDRQALDQVLTQIKGSLPPLKGIVHAATVINDGLIHRMDAEQIRSVLAPKAVGAYHLHAMTLDMPLDFFVLFSSATTLFGNPGQGNYVAANACLETLASKRRAAGLPATCLSWGAIADVGFLARHEKTLEQLQNRMGGVALSSDTALDILEEMILAGRSGFGVLDFDWRALARFLPSASTPKFNALARTVGEREQNEDSGDTLKRMFEELSEEELRTACMDMLKSEVGEILRMTPDKIESTRSLYDMGLDSLMGVELIGALESRFNIRLPALVLSQSPTIAKLADYIIGQLKGDEQAVTDSGEQTMLIQVQQLAQQHGVESAHGSISQLAKDLQVSEGKANTTIIR